MFCLFNFSYQVHFHGPILIYRWGGGGGGKREGLEDFGEIYLILP